MGNGGGVGGGGKPPGGSGGGSDWTAYGTVVSHFDAQDISGWYTDVAKTTSVTTDGDTVRSIDQTAYVGADLTDGPASGQAFPVYKTGIINGFPALYFDTTNTHLYTGDTEANSGIDTDFTVGQTVFLVLNSYGYPGTGIKSNMAFSEQYSTEGMQTFSSFIRVSPGGSSVITENLTTSLATGNHMLTWRIKSGATYIQANQDTALTNSDTGNPNWKHVRIGGRGSVGTTFYCGEMIVFNDYLSDADIAEIQGTLNTKWSLGL
jgi:hypothetical protein